MQRVTGIGGIFFKCEDPDKVRTWYQKHLGLKTDAYGTSFAWHKTDNQSQKGFTQWSPFSNKSTYFGPSTKAFMLNFRVENLTWLIEELKKEGIEILDEIESFEYGKFVHIMDPEGNKIELWEPNDKAFEKIAEGVTSK